MPTARLVYPEVQASGESYGGLHPTAGLPGYPAVDFFAPSGTYVVAPEAGTITRESGTDPSVAPADPHGAYGWSEYLHGISGTMYFITHLGSELVKPGQKVLAGEPIGTVADFAQYGTPSHTHIGTSGPVSVSMLTGAPKEAGGDVAKLAAMWHTSPSALEGKGPVQGALEHIPGVTQTESVVKTGKAAFSDAASFFRWIGNTKNLQRVGEIGAGGILILVGVILIGSSAASSSPASQVRGAAGTAARFAK
jgi:hypothetical protein